MTLPQLTRYDLHPDVLAFSTTRQGGASLGSYAEFNVNEYCGDLPEHIAANRKALCSLLGIGEERLVMPHQTHETSVRRIAPEYFQLSADTRRRLLEGVDAVMTNIPGVCVGVSTADCIPIIIYDAVHRACCAVHAGWRGTVGGIARKAVEAMRQAYGCRAGALRVVIGPGIGPGSFEVGDEVFDAFASAGFPMERLARRREKWHLDLWEANRWLLTESGVNPTRILTDGTCTYEHPDRYFSARRLGIRSGRILTGVMIKRNDADET